MIRILLFLIFISFNINSQDNKKVILDVKNITVEKAIYLVAEQANVNVIISSKISDRITISFYNIDFMEAFRKICLKASLKMEENNGIITFYHADKEFIPEKRKFYIYNVNYGKSAQIVEKLKLIFKDRVVHISANTLSNSIIFYGTKADKAKFLKYLLLIDRKPVQLRIKAQIYTFKRHERISFEKTSFKIFGNKKNISIPELYVISGKQTFFHNGDIISFPVNRNKTEKRKIGIICLIKPIGYDESVYADIELKYLAYKNGVKPEIIEKRSKTSFDIDYGEEYIIGGIIELFKNNKIEKNVILGEGELTSFLKDNAGKIGKRQIITLKFDKEDIIKNN